MGFKNISLPSIGIKGWLLLLVLTTLLPFLAFSAYSIYRLGHDQTEIQEMELMHHAKAAALSVSKSLELSQTFCVYWLRLTKHSAPTCPPCTDWPKSSRSSHRATSPLP